MAFFLLIIGRLIGAFLGVFLTGVVLVLFGIQPTGLNAILFLIVLIAASYFGGKTVGNALFRLGGGYHTSETSSSTALGLQFSLHDAGARCDQNCKKMCGRDRGGMPCEEYSPDFSSFSTDELLKFQEACIKNGW